MVPVLAIVAAGCQRPEHPTLAIGAAARAVSLRGADGQMHALSDYMARPVLAVVFTCNHCPAASCTEARLGRLYAAYHDKGLALVAIDPDGPKTVRLDEMGYTDVDDSLDGMKERVALRKMPYPYLMTVTPRRPRRRSASWRRLRCSSSIAVARCSMQDGSTTTRTSRASALATDRTRSRRCWPVSRSRGDDQGHRLSDSLAVRGRRRRRRTGRDSRRAGHRRADRRGWFTKLRGNGTSQITLVNFWRLGARRASASSPSCKNLPYYKASGLRFCTVSANTPDGRAAVINFCGSIRPRAPTGSSTATTSTRSKQPSIQKCLRRSLHAPDRAKRRRPAPADRRSGRAGTPSRYSCKSRGRPRDPGMHTRWTTQ